MEEQSEPGKQEQDAKKELKSCEHQSDRRTAAFIVRELSRTQDQLCDLIADMRTFEHFAEIDDASFCLRLMQKLKRKYHACAETGV